MMDQLTDDELKELSYYIHPYREQGSWVHGINIGSLDTNPALFLKFVQHAAKVLDKKYVGQICELLTNIMTCSIGERESCICVCRIMLAGFRAQKQKAQNAQEKA